MLLDKSSVNATFAAFIDYTVDECDFQYSFQTKLEFSNDEILLQSLLNSFFLKKR